MDIQGRTVAILATHGFEQCELSVPRTVLRKAGATVQVLAPEAGEIRGFHGLERGDAFAVDRRLADARAGDYDALLIPGGPFGADRLRVHAGALQLVRAFEQACKPLAAVGHGAWLLVNAGLARGRLLAADATVERDLANAGAEVVLDRPVVADGSLLTARGPRDLPDLCRALIERLAVHAQRERYARVA